MTSKNKIPSSWPAALEMADKIAEIIRALKEKAPELTPVELDRAKTEALEEIAKLVGME